MEINDVIQLLGILLGGVIAWLVMKWQIRKKKIDHFIISQEDFGKRLSKDYPGFKLTYAGQELSEGVRVLKGGFIYFGEKDIESKNNAVEIKVELYGKNDKTSSNNISIIGVEIPFYKKGVTVNKEFEGNTIIFRISHAFRTNDYIIYSAIVKLEKDDAMYIQQDCSSTQITDTIIKTKYMGSIQKYNNDKKVVKIILPALYLSFVASMIIIQNISNTFGINNLYVILLCVILFIALIIYSAYGLIKLRRNRRIIKIIEKDK